MNLREILENSIDVDVTFRIVLKKYSAARPAPAAVLHDDPRYGDPGDDAEYDYDLYMINANGTTVPVETDDKIAEYLGEIIDREIDEEMKNYN